MAAKYGYIGNNPADSSVFVARQTFSPSGITTTFTFASGYTIGYLDAYLNGSRLIEGQDYVATNGSTVDLVSAATGGDTLELLAYKAFNTVALTDAPGDFEVGTNLTVGGYISAGGSITGATFYGDGSNLTGVSASKWITTAAGIHTLSNVGIGTTNPRFTLEVGAVGASGTTLFVNGDARVTGIVTIGPASITLNGINNIINVGTGITLDGNTGVISATTYFGNGANLTGISSVSFATTSFGLSGSPNITVGNIVGTAATLTTLNGTSGLVSVGTTIKVKGFVETQSTVSIAGTILTLDASQGTVFTHTTSAQIGIVSFTGIRTDSAGAQTFSVLVTQGATPRNTTGATGIGTQLASISITPGNVGYSTHIKVGGGTSITLTNNAGAFDLLTFIVSYDGNTSIGNTSFTVVGFAATDFRNTVV